MQEITIYMYKMYYDIAQVVPKASLTHLRVLRVNEG